MSNKTKGIEKEIREQWFKDHKVTISSDATITIVDWRKPDTGTFGVRYVLDGCRMYVSGDLGDAVFRFSEKADIHNIARYNLDYFHEKLSAFSDPKYDFDPNQALERLKGWESEYKEDEVNFTDDLAQIRRVIEDSSCVNEFVYGLHELNNALIVYAWEWIYGIGDYIPYRVQSYLLGLKMISEEESNGH